MAFFIDSKDRTEYKYSGSYTFPRSLQGHYKLLTQTFDNNTTTWCNSTNNSLAVWKPSDGETLYLTFDNISSSEPNDIIAWFHKALYPIYTTWSIPYTVTYQSKYKQYMLQFASTIWVGLLLPSEADVGSTRASTIAGLFDWTPNGEGLIPNQNGNVARNDYNIFYISDKNFGTPDLLCVSCEQMVPRMYISRDVNPIPYAFLIHTDAGKIISEDVYIPEQTNFLDLDIKRAGQTSEELAAEFRLFFKPM